MWRSLLNTCDLRCFPEMVATPNVYAEPVFPIDEWWGDYPFIYEMPAYSTVSRVLRWLFRFARTCGCPLFATHLLKCTAFSLWVQNPASLFFSFVYCAFHEWPRSNQSVVVDAVSLSQEAYILRRLENESSCIQNVNGFNMEWCEMTDEIIERISRMKNIRKLMLSHTEVSACDQLLLRIRYSVFIPHVARVRC